MKDVYISDKLYDPRDPAVERVFGSAGHLARWRCFGRGPAYIKIGRAVRYRGSDLNDWLRSRRVETADSILTS